MTQIISYWKHINQDNLTYKMKKEPIPYPHAYSSLAYNSRPNKFYLL